MAKSIVTANFRLEPEDAEKLDYICSIYGLSKTKFFVSTIRSEYDKLNGNPETMKIIKQLTKLSSELNKFTCVYGEDD